MNYTKTSYFPLSNFTKKGCHSDWQMGVGLWNNVKDALVGGTVKKFATVFWNRQLGNLTVSLENYMRVRNDPSFSEKLVKLGLPDDIEVK